MGFHIAQSEWQRCPAPRRLGGVAGSWLRRKRVWSRRSALAELVPSPPRTSTPPLQRASPYSRLGMTNLDLKPKAVVRGVSTQGRGARLAPAAYSHNLTRAPLSRSMNPKPAASAAPSSDSLVDMASSGSKRCGCSGSPEDLQEPRGRHQ